MRTTLDLDKDLMLGLMRESGCRSKTQALELAAREFLRAARRRRILEHFGRVEVEDVSGALRKRERGRL